MMKNVTTSDQLLLFVNQLETTYFGSLKVISEIAKDIPKLVSISNDIVTAICKKARVYSDAIDSLNAGKMSINAKNKYDEKITQAFESLVFQCKFQEALDFLLLPEHIKCIKNQSLGHFIEKLIDANAISSCFNFFKIMIMNRPSVLKKQIVKNFFHIAGRSGNSTACTELVSMLCSRADFENHVDLYLRINQYFLSSLFKNNECDLANNVFKGFRQFYPYNRADNSAVYYKIYEIFIKGCLSKQIEKLEDAKTVLNDVASTKPSDVFFNKIIDFASKSNEISFAEYVFKVMVSNGIQPSIVTYNTLIDSYFKQNRFNQAWILFELLKKSDKKPDNFTYTTMINGLKSVENPDLEKAFILFSEYRQVNTPDQIIYNCMLDACISANNLDKAHELLVEMKKDETIQLDEVTYNTLIKGCCKSKRVSQAISYYEEMKLKKVHPNRITYNSLLDNCVKANKMSSAWQFYEEMIQAGIKADNFTYSILINGVKSNCTHKEELNRALELLNTAQASCEFKPDEILYNSLIDACIKFNEVNKGLFLYEDMKKKHIEPSSITFGILIKAYGKINELVKAFKVFEEMKHKQMKINDVTYGCLLDACVKNDRMDLALVLVDKMKQENVVLNTILYTTLIKGFSKAGRLNDALHIFNIMKGSCKAKPNTITYNCTIDACVKSQNMSKANELFEELINSSTQYKPDLITYSTLIKGFCKQKDIEKAYYYLTLMQKNGVRPDELLFNLLLDSCYHTNKHEMGFDIFESMNKANVLPSNITFSILIKLYSRSRRTQNISEIINVMRSKKVKPSLIIFTNIIQAFFKANKLEKAVETLRELEYENIRWDSIFYEKLVIGFLGFDRVDLASSYCEKSLSEGIMLSQETYTRLFDSLNRSNLANKAAILHQMQSAMRNPTQKYNHQNKQSSFTGERQSKSSCQNQISNSSKAKSYNDKYENKENQSINHPQFQNSIFSTYNNNNSKNLSYGSYHNNKSFAQSKQTIFSKNDEAFFTKSINMSTLHESQSKTNAINFQYSASKLISSSGKKSLTLNNREFITSSKLGNTETKPFFGTVFL